MKLPHISHGSKSSWYRRLGKDAPIDWIAIFSLSVIITVIVVIISVLNFLTMDSRLHEARSLVASNNDSSVIDVQKLEATFKTFSDRTGERESLQQTYYGSLDPSTGAFSSGIMPKTPPPGPKPKPVSVATSTPSVN